MTTPPVDKAAVEAANKFIDSQEEVFRSFGMGVGEYADFFEPLARIITKAYAEQKKPVGIDVAAEDAAEALEEHGYIEKADIDIVAAHIHDSHIEFWRKLNQITKSLTAERDVRERLVVAGSLILADLIGDPLASQFFDKRTLDKFNTALAEAKKLEDVDD